MKIFKNSILALAAIALISFSSCNNDDANINIVEEGDPTHVSIRLSGVVNSRNAATGNTEEAGSTNPGTILLKHAYAFVLNTAGEVLHGQALNRTSDDKPELTVLQKDVNGTMENIAVSPQSRIYVIGNTPDDYRDDLAKLETLTEIHAFTSAMETQKDYKEVVLANVNATPVQVGTAATGTNMATVTVSINPVISRLELHQVSAKSDPVSTSLWIQPLDENGDEDGDKIEEPFMAKITEFKVTGIWVDGTYTNFTYEGGGTVERNTASTSNDVILDAMPVQIDGVDIDAVLENGVLVAKPVKTTGTTPVDQVWAFNVASGNVPRLIVRIEDVKWKADESDEDTVKLFEKYNINIENEYALETKDGEEKKHIITVTGYSGVNVDPINPDGVFVRGNIYQISTGFAFDLNDLGIDVINPPAVNVTVGVRIQEWRAFPTTPSW
jgi:hypothetical protein